MDQTHLRKPQLWSCVVSCGPSRAANFIDSNQTSPGLAAAALLVYKKAAIEHGLASSCLCACAVHAVPVLEMVAPCCLSPWPPDVEGQVLGNSVCEQLISLEAASRPREIPCPMFIALTPLTSALSISHLLTYSLTHSHGTSAWTASRCSTL
jgi:hypothetical protein